MFRDIVVNVSLYMPLGFAAHLAFRRVHLPLFHFYAPVLLGLVLSASVEMIQLYTPGRNTSMLDVTTNVLGTILGVAVAALFEEMAGSAGVRSRLRVADRSGLILAFCWAAWLFFPFFPVLGTFVPISKASTFITSPIFAPLAVLSEAAIWFAAGLLLEAAGIRKSVEWLGFSILAIPAQLFIATRQPVPSDLIGAIAGFLLFAARPRGKQVTKIEAWAFLVVVITRGLSPFQFVATAVPFDWIPFGGVLNAQWQPATLVLLGKIFYYATAIWLLRAAGLRLWRSTAIVAACLGSIEALQTHLPGRTPEITDPLLAVLMSFVLFTLYRETGRRFRSTELSQLPIRGRIPGPGQTGRP